MHWYLLLAFPVFAIVMCAIARSGAITDTDRACTDIDLRLDLQAELIKDGAASAPVWVPQQRLASRVAPRPVMGSEVLVG